MMEVVEAAVTQGGVFWKKRSIMLSGGSTVAMSWMLAGMSSRKRSIAQSVARQFLSDLLHASLSVC